MQEVCLIVAADLTIATICAKIISMSKKMSDSQQEITPELINSLLEVNKMSAKELAEMLNVSEATVHSWRKSGGDRPTGTAAAFLAALLASSGILAAGSLAVAGAPIVGAGTPAGVGARVEQLVGQ
jgi:DNA-binding transcriptional regulator YiaG